MYIFALFEHTIAAIACFFMGKFVLTPSKTIFRIEHLTGRQMEFAQKHGKTADTIARFLCILAIVILIPRTVQVILDLPCALMNRYTETTVIVIENDIHNPNFSDQRDIKVHDLNTSKEYIIHVHGEAIYNDEILKVRILPHSRFGEIVERQP